jgi:hypothetical protein
MSARPARVWVLTANLDPHGPVTVCAWPERPGREDVLAGLLAAESAHPGSECRGHVVERLPLLDPAWA